MKLKAVEKLCKKRGMVCLFDEVVETVDDENTPPRQWMGDGAAVYPLDGVPYLDEGIVNPIHPFRWAMLDGDVQLRF